MLPHEVTDPTEVRALLPRLPLGTEVGGLLARVSVGVLVLAPELDRGAARAAIGVSIQRSHPKGVVLLGAGLGRDLLGEGLPLQGGIRDMYHLPVAGLGRARGGDLERLLADLCQRAHVPWAPPSSRAAPARTVMRAEEAEVQATPLMERQDWAQAVEVLRAAEPLSPRGTNMLARALAQLGDKDGARAAYQRTLAADPANAIAQRQISQLE